MLCIFLLLQLRTFIFLDFLPFLWALNSLTSGWTQNIKKKKMFTPGTTENSSPIFKSFSLRATIACSKLMGSKVRILMDKFRFKRVCDCKSNMSCNKEVMKTVLNWGLQPQTLGSHATLWSFCSGYLKIWQKKKSYFFQIHQGYI